MAWVNPQDPYEVPMNAVGVGCLETCVGAKLECSDCL